MTQTSYRAILLDCDGVLYDDALGLLKAIVPAVKHVALDMGVDEDTYTRTGQALRRAGIKGLMNLIRQLCDDHNLLYECYCARLVTYLTPFYDQLDHDAELVTLLTELLDEVDTVVVYTNNHFLHAVEVIDRRGLAHILTDDRVYDASATVGSDGIFYPKPLPQGYMQVLAKLGIPPSAAIMVDDSPHNIAAAKALGMYGVHITKAPDPTAGADATAPSLKDWLRAFLSQ